MCAIYHHFVQYACALSGVKRCPLFGSLFILLLYEVNRKKGKMSVEWRCPLLGESVIRGSTAAYCTLKSAINRYRRICKYI